MTRIIATIFLQIVILFTVSYANPSEPVYTGTTDDGVYYEVFEVGSGFLDALFSASSRKVTVQVKYDGIVTPPRTITHTDTIKGAVYSGVLQLHSTQHVDGKTVATYRGTIYKKST